MSRMVHRAPLALTSDGTVLVNVTEFDGPRDPESLLERALQQKGAVFIGVELTSDETRRTLRQLSDNYTEAATQVVGPRQRRQSSSVNRNKSSTED